MNDHKNGVLLRFLFKRFLRWWSRKNKKQRWHPTIWAETWKAKDQKLKIVWKDYHHLHTSLSRMLFEFIISMHITLYSDLMWRIHTSGKLIKRLILNVRLIKLIWTDININSYELFEFFFLIPLELLSVNLYNTHNSSKIYDLNDFFCLECVHGLKNTHQVNITKLVVVFFFTCSPETILK